MKHHRHPGETDHEILVLLLEVTMAKIDELTAAVQAQTDAIAALAARIAAIPAGTPDAALQPVLDQVTANTAQITALVP